MEDLNLYLKNYVNNLSKSILNLDNNELKKATKLILGKIKKIIRYLFVVMAVQLLLQITTYAII